MGIYFVVVGIAALAYFIVILLYNGMTSFLWFWPVFAAAHFLLAAYLRYLKGKRKKKQEYDLRLPVFVFTSYGLGLVVLLTTIAMMFHSLSTPLERNLDYVIVVGTDLQNNRISPSLRTRLERAIEYHKENPSTTFVLSGGHGNYNTATEAGVMYYYMVQHGVPPHKLLMEFYSDSTQEKIGYSIQTIRMDRQERYKASYDKGRAVGDIEGMLVPDGVPVVVAEERPLRIGIITSEFNVFRAIRMANRYGVEEAYPMGTKTDEVLLLHLSVREATAILKDRIVGNI